MHVQHVFAVVFTLEMVLRIVAHGCCKSKRVRNVGGELQPG